MNSKATTFLLMSTSLIGLGMTGSLQAQTISSPSTALPPDVVVTPPGAPASDAAAQAPAKTESSEALGDIIVTARKREETASRIPETISVVGSAAIQSRNITNLANVQTLVPAFSFAQLQDPSVVYVSIRGINSVRNSENPVAFVVDGVQTNDASQINLQITDIDRVEILKGPQGSLYGRNAIGGAINIITKKPTNDFSGTVKLTYENGNERDAGGSISGPIIKDVLLFRVGGQVRTYDGLIENEILHSKVDYFSDQNVFGKLYFAPIAELSFELKASHFHTRGGSYYYKLVGTGNTNKEIDFPILGTPNGLSELSDDQISLKGDIDLGFATLTSVSALNHNKNLLDGDIGFTPQDIGQLGEKFDNRAFNEDVRLTSRIDGSLKWVAGAYYLHKKQHAVAPVYLGSASVPGAVQPRDLGIELESFFNYPAAPGTLLYHRTDFEFTNDAYAAYAQGDYDLSRTLTITAGLRYDKEKRSAVNNGTVAFDPTTGKTGLIPADADVAKYRSNTYSAFQPKASIAFKPTSDRLYYATFSQGFRSGGFNNTLRPQFATYGAEKLTNFEIGAKGTFLDGRLRVEAAIFHMIDRNRPDFFFSITDSTQNIFSIATVRINGVELNVNAAPARGLTLSAGLSLLDTRIEQIDTTAIDPDPAHSGLGRHPSYVYHQQFTASAQYITSIGSGIDAFIGSDFLLKAGNYFWYTNDGFKQEPIPLLNGRLGVKRNGAEIRIFAENLLNFSYVTSHDPSFVFGFAGDDAFPAPPRRYGVTVSYQF